MYFTEDARTIPDDRFDRGNVASCRSKQGTNTVEDGRGQVRVADNSGTLNRAALDLAHGGDSRKRTPLLFVLVQFQGEY